MAKITYSNLKLKTKEEVKEIDFNGNKIEINQYLSIKDKIDLIDITLQKSKEENIYNPIKVDMYFHLHLIYLYTNISFTEKQREDESKLYDALESNGLINAVVAEIPEKEYNDLLKLTDERIETEMKYSTTLAGIISQIIETLPEATQKAADIMKEFDPSKFQEVINFARAANGDRPIE